MRIRDTKEFSILVLRVYKFDLSELRKKIVGFKWKKKQRRVKIFSFSLRILRSVLINTALTNTIQTCRTVVSTKFLFVLNELIGIALSYSEAKLYNKTKKVSLRSKSNLGK